MGKSVIAVVAMIFMSQPAMAHPVSFQDSVGVMGFHSNLLTHNQINYSYRYWLAGGVHYFKRMDKANGGYATLASANVLFHRWNGSASQGNLYGIFGAGYSELSAKPQGVGMAALQFDIEDRKYYFLAKHMEMFNKNQVELSQSVVRAGIAPYIDPFEGFHTWLILEWQSNKFNRDTAIDDVTPYLRFFYRNVLFEIGQSFNGITRFNYIVHF